MWKRFAICNLRQCATICMISYTLVSYQERYYHYFPNHRTYVCLFIVQEVGLLHHGINRHTIKFAKLTLAMRNCRFRFGRCGLLLLLKYQPSIVLQFLPKIFSLSKWGLYSPWRLCRRGNRKGFGDAEEWGGGGGGEGLYGPSSEPKQVNSVIWINQEIFQLSFIVFKR